MYLIQSVNWNMENIIFPTIKPIYDYSYVINTQTLCNLLGGWQGVKRAANPVGSPGLTTNNQRLSSADRVAL